MLDQSVKVSSGLLLRSTFLIKSLVSDHTANLSDPTANSFWQHNIPNHVILCLQLLLCCGTIEPNIIDKILLKNSKCLPVCQALLSDLSTSIYLSIYLIKNIFALGLYWWSNLFRKCCHRLLYAAIIVFLLEGNIEKSQKLMKSMKIVNIEELN